MGKEKEHKKVLSDFVDILSNVHILREKRSRHLARLFWEYEHMNIDRFEDSETKFMKYVPERRTYPNAFLTSSLGFTKSSMQIKYNNILSKFGLDIRPRSNTLENALLFERLKLLIVKYYDMQKK